MSPRPMTDCKSPTTMWPRVGAPGPVLCPVTEAVHAARRIKPRWPEVGGRRAVLAKAEATTLRLRFGGPKPTRGRSTAAWPVKRRPHTPPEERDDAEQRSRTDGEIRSSRSPSSPVGTSRCGTPPRQAASRKPEEPMSRSTRPIAQWGRITGEPDAVSQGWSRVDQARTRYGLRPIRRERASPRGTCGYVSRALRRAPLTVQPNPGPQGCGGIGC